MKTLDLGGLGLDRGGHLLVRRALAEVDVGGRVQVEGADPALGVHLRAWARGRGHGFEPGPPPIVIRTSLEDQRWSGAVAAGDAARPSERASASWGLAARGARVEAGLAPLEFPLATRDQIWTDDAARLYARAAAAQWDPETAIDWGAPFELPDAVETAVVQVMTYLIENEVAALIVPARFLARIHPHFREILQILAVQAADEARHIEVFTRRALLKRPAPGLSTVGGQTSLRTLLEEPDFALASFLLSVLGEGSFLSLLWFLAEHGPDPITRQITTLAAQDEARHVAFGLSHLQHHAEREPGLRARMANAVEQRFAALQHTAGLNEEVFDALVLLAAGSWEPGAIARGFDAVVALRQDMDRGRRTRLARLGFDAEEAERLSSLHTRNFM
ncbi:ferritin-like domain-containing protein [Enhygromyxa salina]|uniref:Ferritin-like domain-containing protein n=1 Tax=Enhygromyxa salina TaxID=215803 RepID=A0A2S9XL04_9BACT|nr:ferritin-like domain-containing protein [Enhygromyxa salina]PRP93558.1 hypothetical protein ENSA7_79860 [Enhygromyxa salina]